MNEKMTEVRKLAAEVFNASLEQVPPDARFGSVPGWDSLGHMRLLMLLEERYRITISEERIRAFLSLRAIAEYLGGGEKG
ncbi:MAG: hypothetical protein A2107_09115 [Verrucomicrobia bacterium GWF2_62_7]|nr:MAG: hypothetical protein A2107_09115 [Verrucomicrobia bacterium GWF2_62_7]